MKLNLEVEQQLLERFEAVKKAADEQGYAVEIESAMTAFLAGQITRAEKVLAESGR